jgi:uncharacterized protein
MLRHPQLVVAGGVSTAPSDDTSGNEAPAPNNVGPVKLLVLQGTPFCNIDCVYCYLPDRDNKARMSVDTVAALVRRLREDQLLSGPLLVNWHAGEPLVLPPAFYEERIPLFDPLVEAGIPVTHSLQTNGILIDDAYCALFKRFDVKIGVSVDGPAFLHDSRRVTRSGKGTHAAVVAGMRLLQKHEIPFNVICVLTARALHHPREIYAWLRETGVRAVAFNLEEIEGANLTSSLADPGFDEAYRSFLEELWQLVERDGRALRVREFDDIEGRILDHMPRRNSQTDPFINLTVASNGDYSTFCPELLGTSFPDFPDFRLGNVHQDGFRASMRSPTFQRLWREIGQGVQACRDECAYFDVCGGGNPSNKIAENGSFTSTRTRNCASRIMTTSNFVIGKIEERIEARRRAAGGSP